MKSSFIYTPVLSSFASFEAISPAVFLVRKLIAVLEMSERLPVYSFESMGSGLQILTRRLRLRLERAPGENGLIDRTGRNLRIEPLTTVGSLKNYLSRMVGTSCSTQQKTPQSCCSSIFKMFCSRYCIAKSKR